MVRIWLISDTHFGHEAMCRTFTTPTGDPVRVHPERGDRFKGAEECDQFMIEKWNDVVMEADHIYHLGDVTMRRGFLSIIPALKGHKRLVRGNHDIFRTAEYVKSGFKEIYGVRVLANCILSHVPIHPESLGRFVGNIHGHIHERDAFGEKYENVSVERTAYQPILLDEVVERLKAR